MGRFSRQMAASTEQQHQVRGAQHHLTWSSVRCLRCAGAGCSRSSIDGQEHRQQQVQLFE